MLVNVGMRMIELLVVVKCGLKGKVVISILGKVIGRLFRIFRVSLFFVLLLRLIIVWM